jgi:general secretion pathway protein N
MDSLVATRDLPLFSPSRQPVKKPEVPFQAPAVALVVERISPPNISLVGVIMRGDSGVGLFADNETKSLLRLHVGESYNGWKLVSVVGRRVTLQRKDARVDLALASASDN